MDSSSDPNLQLDELGTCNYCRYYDEEVKKIQYIRDDGAKKLRDLFEQIKQEEKEKEYDCLLGISGGVDSSYLAYLAKQHNLRVLAVHVDAGWNSELAVKNIEKMCSKLGYDLHTVVVDWNVMKELQRAFMFSGLANLDIPQDHCFIAGVNEMARKYKIKYVLSGYNLATEGILSTAFQRSSRDWALIKDVYRKYGRGTNIASYPHENFIKMWLYKTKMQDIKTIYPLQYIEYSKSSAIELLSREFGWEYYGGKHYESRFTKFFQEIYLPQRYGWYKQRDHISSLIVGGELTREEGLKEMNSSFPSEQSLKQELDYILKKLDITEEEWEAILNGPYKTGDDYKDYSNIMKIMSYGGNIKKILRLR